MNVKTKRLQKKLALLVGLSLVAMLLYGTWGLQFGNPKLLVYALRLRLPRIFAIVLAATAIGGATIVFQSIIHNRIVTPCLLGMNSIYLLTHTTIIFFLGAGSFLAGKTNLLFVIDVFTMSLIASILYNYLFRKTKYNILYILLIGTVLTSLFSSLQVSMVRAMDPNEYDSLLSSLVANFNNINTEVIGLATLLLLGIVFAFRKELALLDVLALGRAQAINLGVDYDKAVKSLLMGVSLAIAIATAMVGPISFLGLIIANLARQFLKSYRHTYLMTGAAAFGCLLILGGQLIVEKVFHYSIPISVFITMAGGSYFLYLILHERKI